MKLIALHGLVVLTTYYALGSILEHYNLYETNWGIALGLTLGNMFMSYYKQNSKLNKG